MQEHARTCLSPKLTQNQNFFCGGGNRKPKTSDFFAPNIRTFMSKPRHFPSKKSDVFDFRRGNIIIPLIPQNYYKLTFRKLNRISACDQGTPRGGNEHIAQGIALGYVLAGPSARSLNACQLQVNTCEILNNCIRIIAFYVKLLAT